MYLNNYSNSQVTIQLTAKRVIEPLTSLPLNDKDVLLVKEMIEARKGKSKMFTETLRLSRIRIEDDSNYKKMCEDAKINAEVKAEELKPQFEDAANLTKGTATAIANKAATNIPATPNETGEIKEDDVPDDVKAFLNGETDEVPEGTEVISEEEAAKLAAQSEGTEPEANEGEGAKDENPAEGEGTEPEANEGEGTEDNGPQEGTVTLAAEVDNIIENPNFDDAAKTQALIDLAAEHKISLGRAKNLGKIAEIIKTAKGE